MNLVDRILTIVVTATLTSAVWIVAGGSLIENATSPSQRNATRPAEAVSRPTPPEPEPEREDVSDGDALASSVQQAAALDTETSGPVDERAARELLIPVLNIRPSDLTDTYSASDGDNRELHEAIDIMAPIGTTVVAAAPGEIERLFNSRAGGKTIFVRSPDRRTIHFYAHLNHYAEGLREGQRVRRGQRLGSVGTTGNASIDAPHLHFAILQTTPDAEWWEPANAINPYPLLSRPRN